MKSRHPVLGYIREQKAFVSVSGPNRGLPGKAARYKRRVSQLSIHESSWFFFRWWAEESLDFGDSKQSVGNTAKHPPAVTSPRWPCFLLLSGLQEARSSFTRLLYFLNSKHCHLVISLKTCTNMHMMLNPSPHQLSHHSLKLCLLIWAGWTIPNNLVSIWDQAKQGQCHRLWYWNWCVDL